MLSRPVALQSFKPIAGWAHQVVQRIAHQGSKVQRILAQFHHAALQLGDHGIKIGGNAAVAEEIDFFLRKIDVVAQQGLDLDERLAEGGQSSGEAAFELAQHYRAEVLPLRQRIAEENLLRYNGMFISTFDLLADARRQVQAVDGYLQAQRDFWLARADLDMALLGAPNSSLGAAPAATAEPAAAGH